MKMRISAMRRDGHCFFSNLRRPRVYYKMVDVCGYIQSMHMRTHVGVSRTASAWTGVSGGDGNRK
jgi:hypothetical protein